MEGYHPSSSKPREDDILWSFSAPNVEAQTNDKSSDEPEEMEDENSLQDRTIEMGRNLEGYHMGFHNTEEMHVSEDIEWRGELAQWTHRMACL